MSHIQHICSRQLWKLKYMYTRWTELKTLLQKNELLVMSNSPFAKIFSKVICCKCFRTRLQVWKSEVVNDCIRYDGYQFDTKEENIMSDKIVKTHLWILSNVSPYQHSQIDLLYWDIEYLWVEIQIVQSPIMCQWWH